MKNRLLCIVLCYNNEKTLNGLVADLERSGVIKIADILFVNDSSTDGTAEILKQLSFPKIVHKKNMGYGAGVKSGIEYAYNNGYDFATLFPGDHQRSAIDVINLFNEIKYSDLDVLVGSKFHIYSKKYGPIKRRLGNILFSFIAIKMWSSPVSDVLSGFKIYRIDSVKDFYKDLPDRYPFDIVFSFLSSFYGLRIKEISVGCRYNEHTSKMTNVVLVSIKMMSQLLFYTFFTLYSKSPVNLSYKAKCP